MMKKSLSLGLFGYGSFGKLAARHLSRYFKLVIYDPKIPKKGKLPSNCQAGTLAEAAQTDVIVLAVNLSQLKSLLQTIKPHIKAGALVVDVASVKVKPVRLLKQVIPKHAQVLATHPLFGPQSVDSDNLAGNTIIIHPVRVHNLPKIKQFLKSTLGLRIVEMSPADHDRKMALVHGLTFFLARGLIKMDLPVNGLGAPSYRKLLSLAELESHHSRQLFETIEVGNPYASAIRQKMIKNLIKLHQQTLKKKF